MFGFQGDGFGIWGLRVLRLALQNFGFYVSGSQEFVSFGFRG